MAQAKQGLIRVQQSFDTKRVVVQTSATNKEVAKKIKQVSRMLMEKNKRAYKELANAP